MQMHGWARLIRDGRSEIQAGIELSREQNPPKRPRLSSG